MMPFDSYDLQNYEFKRKRNIFNSNWNFKQIFDCVNKLIIRFKEISDNKIKVVIHHDGWGEGGEWDQAYTYFVRAWKEVVLPRLKYRFDVGPIDWENPSKLN